MVYLIVEGGKKKGNDGHHGQTSSRSIPGGTGHQTLPIREVEPMRATGAPTSGIEAVATPQFGSRNANWRVNAKPHGVSFTALTTVLVAGGGVVVT